MMFASVCSVFVFLVTQSCQGVLRPGQVDDCQGGHRAGGMEVWVVAMLVAKVAEVATVFEEVNCNS